MKNLVTCETITGDIIDIDKARLIFRPAAYGVIIKDEQILLVNTRSSGKYFFPGGAMEEGEMSHNALTREVFEETGTAINNIQLITNVERFFYYEPLNKAYHAINIIYRADFISQTDDFENPDKTDEADGCNWVPIETLTKNDMQSFAWDIISKIKNDLKK